MLGGGTGPPPHQSPLDLLSLLQFVLTAVLVAAGLLVLLRSAASKYFVVDGSFEPEAHGYEETPRRPMSIGLGRGKEEAAGAVGGDASSSSDAGPARCFVCGNIGTKVCRGCKSARYCSLDCQSKHWKEEHRLKCRKKDSTSGIALVPGCGTSVRASCKVLERPKKILFPYDEFIKLYYSDMQVSPPCGLLNCGNSCFANVVLQCLTSTRPLVAYLLEGCHSRECRRKSRNDWCFLCELQIHIQRSKQSQQPFSPMSILSRLPSISSNLGYGRQEDAHEFMRFAIDTMQTICLDEYGGEKALDPSTQETTLIQHIFGGHLQSQVICTNCKMVSNRYENMMDLTVEIQGDAESLEKCLDQFTAKEWLDGENMYKCDGCNGYVKAWKRLTVHQAPNILTIALKRFQSGRFGKLNKRVTFPEILDLGPYMSSNGDATDVYTLYAVVVHLDMLNASFFGHYICYTKDHHGNWYRIDDCKVMQVDVEEVLSQGAYMLLYSRLKVRQPNPLEVAKQNVASSAQVADISSDKSKSVTSMEASCDIGSKLERKAMDIDKPEISILDQTCQDLWDVHGDTTKQNLLQLNELEEENASSPKEDNMMKSQGPICGSQGLEHAKAKTGSSSDAGEEFDVIRVLSSDSTTEVAPASSVVSICTVGSAPQKSEENLSLSEKFVGSKPEKAGTDALAELPNDPGTVDDSPHSSNGKTKTLALASTGSSNRRVQAKPLFSRGFLDKPLIKKKPVSQAKVSQAVEGNSVSSYKKDGKCNILPEPKSAIKSESEFRSKSFDTNIRNVCVDSESKYQGEIDVGLCYSNDGVSNGYPSYKPVQQSFYDGESCQKSVSHNMDYSMPAICHGKPIGRNQNDSGLDNMNLHEDCCLSKEKCNGFSGSHIHQGGANGFVRLPHLKPKGA